MIPIERATKGDLQSILTLQKLAYLSEAKLIDDYNIPPLTQTFDEILQEFEHQVFLKVSVESEIIASVRACREKGTCYIGKLIVHPDHQGRGTGSMLLRAAEDIFDDVERFELFTSSKSERNLYIYQKHGYQVFRKLSVSEKLTILFLEKLVPGRSDFSPTNETIRC